MRRDVTLLWALRSPCSLACRYCYFGEVDDHRLSPPTEPGQLSHLSREDISLADMAAFLASADRSAIRRVFLAGGEPLNWPHSLTVAQLLKDAGIQVVICTNGIPLNRADVVARILSLGVDAVSVSLDSAEASHHDRYRPARNGGHGWAAVVSGLRQLLAARGKSPVPRIGLYTVITRRNIAAVREVGELASRLGVDYFVPQPISLPAGHKLGRELSLGTDDRPAVTSALDDLYRDRLPLALPAADYRHRFTDVIATPELLPVRGCFGGDTLFFVEPDGSVWDCPSSYKIAATPAGRRRNIVGHDAAEMFGPHRDTGPSDCPLGSRDCVNMWPLMGFDRFISPGAGQ